jgi:hypothetical protein
MMIMLHVAIALTSLAVAVYACWRPSAQIMKLNYSLIVATVGSGVGLIVIDSSQMLHACMMGLGYVIVAGVLSEVMRRRWTAMRAMYQSR